MKRFMAFILIILSLFCFSACNENSQNKKGEPSESVETDISVETVYNDFLNGRITAEYGDGSDIDIEYLKEMATPHKVSYSMFDRNGDSIPELCINNELYVTTFWVSDGVLKLWREENSYSKILSNGNCLETHYGGAPNHTDYSYQIYSYTGNVVSSITVSVLIKNDIDVLEDTYRLNVYVDNGNAQVIPLPVEITKEYFDSVIESIEEIGEAELEWLPVE